MSADAESAETGGIAPEQGNSAVRKKNAILKQRKAMSDSI